MDEAVNYRMKLVIDPKNVVKANRELRAMERYFERIQGRVMKIGRTRMVPEIMIRDFASKQIDGVLGKLSRLRSVKMDLLNRKQVNSNGVDPNTLLLTTVLQANTIALQQNTLTLSKSANSKINIEINPVITALSFGNGPANVPAKDEGKSEGFGEKLLGFLQDSLKILEGMKLLDPTFLKRIPKKIFGPLGTILDIIAIATSEGRGRAEAIGSAVGGIGGGLLLGAAGTALLGPGGGVAGAFLGGILGGFGGEFLGGLIYDYRKQIGDFFVSFAKWNLDAINWISTQTSTLFSTVGSYLSEAATNAKDTLGSWGSWISDQGSILSDNVNGYVSQIASNTTGVLTSGKDFVSNQLDNISNSVRGFISQLTDDPMGTLVSGKEYISNQLGNVNNSAGNFISQATTDPMGMLAGSKDFVTNQLDNIRNSTSGFVSQFAMNSKSVLDTGKEWIETEGNKIKESLRSFSTQFLQEGNNKSSNSVSNYSAQKDEPNVKATPSKPNSIMQNNTGMLTILFEKLNGFLKEKGPEIRETLNYQVASHNNAPALSAATKNGQQIPQLVQISPEQMGQLSGYLQNFKKDTINNVSVNFPAGAVQMNVHENAIDIGAIVSQVAARLDAELRKAQQNRKPALP